MWNAETTNWDLCAFLLPFHCPHCLWVIKRFISFSEHSTNVYALALGDCKQIPFKKKEYNFFHWWKSVESYAFWIVKAENPGREKSEL